MGAAYRPQSANSAKYGHTFAMRVKVRLTGARTAEFVDAYHHTFDAYDAALDRYGNAVERIEVTTLPSAPGEATP